jgi:hypothetical protein
MSQLLAGTGPFALTKTWYVDGTATDVGDVTVGITDGNGDEIVAAGTATTNNADGTYSYTLADQANPDQLKITWTRTSTGADLVDNVELVGNWLFTEAQARAFGAKADATSALKPLASETEYPDSTISDERARIADDLEFWTGRAWIPRYARIELNGNGRTWLNLRDGICRTSDGYTLNRPAKYADIGKLLSVAVDGTAVTLTDLEVDQTRAWLLHKNGSFTAGTVTTPYNVVVEYVYGLPYISDGADRIALAELLDRLIPSGAPDRALRWDMPDGSSMSMVQPGGPMDNVSRLPHVNAWVKQHNYRLYI